MSELNVGGLVATMDVEDRLWDSKLTKADADLKRAGAKAEQHMAGVERSFRKAGDTAAAASADISGSVQRMADRVAAAQSRLARAHEQEADALAEVLKASNNLDFQRIGGDTDKVTAATNRLDAALGKLVRSQREVAGSSKALAAVQAEMREAGEDAARQLGKGASSTLARLGPLLAPAGVIAGAAAAEGVVLGFGAGLIGLGVVSAKESQHVKDEWAATGSHIKRTSASIFEPYAESLLDISAQTRATFDGFVPALDRSADRLAPALTRFSGNVSKALLNLEPAIDPMTRATEKALDSLGGRLPSVTARLERGMHSLADSIEENPEALADLADGAGAAGEAVLKLVAAVNKLYGPTRDSVTWLADLNDKIAELTGFDDDRLKWDKGLQDTDQAAQGTSQALDKTRQSAEDLAAAHEQAERAAERHAAALERLQDVAYAQVDAELALRDAIDSGDDAMADYNESVKAHGVNSEQASDALRVLEGESLRVAEAARDNALAQQAAAGKARDVVGANLAARDALAQLAAQARGPARDAILAQIGVLNTLIAQLRSIPGTYAAKVQVTVSQTGRYSGPPIGAMPRYARGGSIGAGEIGQVAENEPEVLSTGGKSYLLMHNQPGYITPVSQMPAAGGGHGGAPTAVTVYLDGSGLPDVIWRSIKDRVRVEGGGNVQVALGRRH